MDAVKSRSAQPRKMLRADLLQPGDVILSSGFDMKDRVVVLATRKGNPARRYSHAALVISNSDWFESTIEGTGITRHKVHTVRRRSEGVFQSFIDVSEYRE